MICKHHGFFCHNIGCTTSENSSKARLRPSCTCLACRVRYFLLIRLTCLMRCNLLCSIAKPYTFQLRDIFPTREVLLQHKLYNLQGQHIYDGACLLYHFFRKAYSCFPTTKMYLSRESGVVPSASLSASGITLSLHVLNYCLTDLRLRFCTCQGGLRCRCLPTPSPYMLNCCLTIHDHGSVTQIANPGDNYLAQIIGPVNQSWFLIEN